MSTTEHSLKEHLIELEEKQYRMVLMHDDTQGYYYECDDGLNSALESAYNGDLDIYPSEEIFLVYDAENFLAKLNTGDDSPFKLLVDDAAHITSHGEDGLFDGSQESATTPASEPAPASFRTMNRAAAASVTMKAAAAGIDFLAEATITDITAAVGAADPSYSVKPQETGGTVSSYTIVKQDATPGTAPTTLVKIDKNGISTKSTDENKPDKIKAFVAAAKAIIDSSDPTTGVIAFEVNCENLQFMADAVKELMAQGVPVKIKEPAKLEQIRTQGLLGDKMESYDTQLLTLEANLAAATSTSPATATI